MHQNSIFDIAIDAGSSQFFCLYTLLCEPYKTGSDYRDEVSVGPLSEFPRLPLLGLSAIGPSHLSSARDKGEITPSQAQRRATIQGPNLKNQKTWLYEYYSIIYYSLQRRSGSTKLYSEGVFPFIYVYRAYKLFVNMPTREKKKLKISSYPRFVFAQFHFWIMSPLI